MVAITCALLLPALSHATDTESLKAACLNNAQAMGSALLGYASEHGGVLPADHRDLNPADTLDGTRANPDSEEAFAASWFAKVESSVSPEQLDCPLVDDQRKGDWWPVDYVINRWAINTSTAVAAEPARGVLVAEPNMFRGSVETLADCVAWYEWGPRPDLEQNMVRSLSFVFMDGHAARIAIPEGDTPHLVDYPQILMSAPAATDYTTNYLWLYQGQQRPEPN
ncbi:MAG: hypothetical protein IT442_12510 [Phycisphaeraceae bacterium]|nr:hypothetical protein [Phycisphaeraceae bacterium]